MARRRLPRGKKIGFHAHNNLQLAFAKTVQAEECGADFLDSTLGGLGRGAGNCNTELLLGYLGRDIAPAMRCVQREIEPMRQKLGWGFAQSYMIAGFLNQHPRAAMAYQEKTPDADILEFYEASKAAKDAEITARGRTAVRAQPVFIGQTILPADSRVDRQRRILLIDAFPLRFSSRSRITPPSPTYGAIPAWLRPATAPEISFTLLPAKSAGRIVSNPCRISFFFTGFVTGTGFSEVRASPRGKSPAANSDGEMGDPAELKSRAFICLVKQRGSRGFPAARRVVSDDIVQGRAFSPHRITTGRGPSLQQRSAFLAVWGANRAPSPPHGAHLCNQKPPPVRR